MCTLLISVNVNTHHMCDHFEMFAYKSQLLRVNNLGNLFFSRTGRRPGLFTASVLGQTRGENKDLFLTISLFQFFFFFDNFFFSFINENLSHQNKKPSKYKIF